MCSVYCVLCTSTFTLLVLRIFRRFLRNQMALKHLNIASLLNFGGLREHCISPNECWITDTKVSSHLTTTDGDQTSFSISDRQHSPKWKIMADIILHHPQQLAKFLNMLKSVFNLFPTFVWALAFWRTYPIKAVLRCDKA